MVEDATLTYRAVRGGGCHFNIQGREGVEDATLTYRAGRWWRMPL